MTPPFCLAMPLPDVSPSDPGAGGPGRRAALWTLLRFGVRLLRVSASTLAVVALLQERWLAGMACGAVWLLLLAVPRVLPLLAEGEAATATAAADQGDPQRPEA